MTYTFPKGIEKPDTLLEAEGVVVYDPSSGSRKDPWWIILECNKDMARFYRELFFWENKIRLFPPAWGCHISINRGMEPPNKENWGLDAGRIIRFAYDPCDIGTNGKHWWLHCYSDEILELREKIGLPPDAHHKWKRFHLTFGKKWE